MKSSVKPDHLINSALIGVYVPRSWAQYLVLYSLAKSQTKSRLTRCLIKQWIERVSDKEPDFVLVGEVSRRIQMRWDHRKSLLSGDKRKRAFESLVTSEKRRLRAKRLDEGIISEIISKVTI